MSDLSTFAANALLDLVLNGQPIANIADNAASSPLTDLYISLHTADPGEGGTQATSEADYGGYARVAIDRDDTRWTVASSVATLVGAVEFPKATGSGTAITHFAIGLGSSGTSEIFARGPVRDSSLDPTSLTPALDDVPRIPAGATVTLA